MHRRGLRTRRGGFTLIELLVVLLIIAILVAVAVPLLLRSRAAANEASAIGTLRTLITCEETFRQANERFGTIDEMYLQQLIDTEVGGKKKSGYLFESFLDPATWRGTWYMEGVPETYNRTGLNSYYVDESGVIRMRDTGGNSWTDRADAELWTSIE